MTNRKKIDKSQDAILARGGGNATAAGVDFQAKLGAWFASQLLAERPLDARLTGKKLKSLRFETEAPVDDILIETDEGWIYIQAKTSLTFSKSKHSEFVKTIEQFVRQWLACNNGDGSLGWNRPLHPDKDRMVLALGPNAPRSLSTNLAQSLATIQTSGFVELPKTKAEAVKKFKELLERSWKDLTGRTASPSDIQGLLSLVTVQTFDFDGAHNQTATEILSHILDKPEQAGATFLAISQYCQELMKMRSGCDTAQLRSSLLGTGIPLTAPPSYRSDVESLKGFSKHIRQHLREYESTMLAGDNIRIERECTNIVVDAARSGSLLLVGEPGAGKSAVINSCAAILIEEGYDVIELAVDRLPVKSLSDLAAEIGLSHPLREVLCNWTGKQPAFLFIDALDATRGGDNEAVFRTLIADVLTFETCQWHVIASIRTFDLRMGEQFKHIFQGDPPNVIFSDPAFPNVKHILVPPWTKKEFTILLQNAPILEKAIETGGERLLELAQVPFNTRLIADLISGGLTPYNFGEINSQVH